jgi:hypothetical protein
VLVGGRDMRDCQGGEERVSDAGEGGTSEAKRSDRRPRVCV